MNWENLVGKLVTNDRGETAYCVVSYCESPTVELEQLETKERMAFGIHGLTAGEFVPLIPMVPKMKEVYEEAPDGR